MDPEILNRAIEIIQADPSSYGINPQPKASPYFSGGTIQIDDGPVETYDEYNNRIKREEEQNRVDMDEDIKNFNFIDYYNKSNHNGVLDKFYQNPSKHPDGSYVDRYQQDYDSMIKNRSQEEYDAMMRGRQPSPGLLSY